MLDLLFYRYLVTAKKLGLCRFTGEKT